MNASTKGGARAGHAVEGGPDGNFVAAIARPGAGQLRIQPFMQHCLVTDQPAGLMVQLYAGSEQGCAVAQAAHRLGLDSLAFYRGVIEVLAMLSRLKARGVHLPCTIAVPEQVLCEAQLVPRLCAWVHRYGLEEGLLTLEIESVLTGLLTRQGIHRQLRKLCDAGFNVSCTGVDAVGAALMAGRWRRCLQIKVPAGELLGIGVGRLSQKIAKKLGVAVVAEHISEADQVPALVAMGIQYGQGSLFAIPEQIAAELPQPQSSYMNVISFK